MVISFDELPEENDVLGEESPSEGLEALSSHFSSHMVNTVLWCHVLYQGSNWVKENPSPEVSMI